MPMLPLINNKHKIDIVDQLSQTQRNEFLITGYINSANKLNNIVPMEIVNICRKYIGKNGITIQSNTELKEQLIWEKWLQKRSKSKKTVDYYDRSRVHKIAILGAGAVGKTSITIRLVANEWNTDQWYDDRAGYQHILEVFGGHEELDILDTAGQEQFAALQDHWIREHEVFVLVYAINSFRSFRYIEDIYKKIIRHKEDIPINVILIGNKMDLPYEREVTYEQGLKKANDFNASFFETSAKTGENVLDAFTALIEQVIKDKYTRECEEIKEKLKSKEKEKSIDGCCHML